MAAAVRLARRNLGLTAPNPCVGAIVVAAGPGGPRVVGRGVTAPGGRPHAEPQALAEAGAAARGATLYVTLEPCSHHGRTPPCVDAIRAAGIQRVVAALEDPDPRVAGRGFAVLREAGIAVTTGVGAEEAFDGLCGHLSRIRLGRPRVLLKLAVSADRMIGRREVPNLAVTGPEALARSHLLRLESDAILIGIGTALVDDPALTVRLPGLAETSPVRVVLDSRLRLPVSSRLARSAREVPVIVVAADPVDPGRRAALAACGVEVETVARGIDGRLDPSAVTAVLARRGITSLMIEGGAEVAAAFVAADLVDTVARFESDRVIGEGGVAEPAALIEALAPGSGRFHPSTRETRGADRLTFWRRRPDALATRPERI
jgi:diaminohydroxyphosphoribosylaminopyrimidine deaminase/5-amino-6-(5-phosphoribosylamino)uracil reductase